VSGWDGMHKSREGVESFQDGLFGNGWADLRNRITGIRPAWVVKFILVPSIVTFCMDLRAGFTIALLTEKLTPLFFD